MTYRLGRGFAAAVVSSSTPTALNRRAARRIPRFASASEPVGVRGLGRPADRFLCTGDAGPSATASNNATRVSIYDLPSAGARAA